MKPEGIRKKLAEKGLRVTPQRLLVFEAIINLKTHPTADNIVEYVRKNHPNIAVGTVYKVLETLVEHNLISRVKTENDVMRYDGVTDYHHHLYCSESDRIEDYSDENLQKIIYDYFNKNDIPGFEIEDIRLQIIGKFYTKT